MKWSRSTLLTRAFVRLWLRSVMTLALFSTLGIALIPRPTPLPGDIIDYLETFALNFFQGFSDQERAFDEAL